MQRDPYPALKCKLESAPLLLLSMSNEKLLV